MAKKKINKKKIKIKYDNLAVLVFGICMVAFVLSRIFFSYYNHSLSIQSGNLSKELSKLSDQFSAIENEVNELKSRDRVVAVAEEDGIKTNQDHVVVMDEKDIESDEN